MPLDLRAEGPREPDEEDRAADSVHVVVPVDQERLTRLDRALDARRRALHLREPRRVVEEVERGGEQVLDGLGILVSAVDDEAREDLGQALGLHEAPHHLRVRLRHPPAAAAVVADGRIAALPGVRGRCGESGSGRRGRHDPRLPSRDGHARCRSCLPP